MKYLGIEEVSNSVSICKWIKYKDLTIIIFLNLWLYCVLTKSIRIINVKSLTSYVSAKIKEVVMVRFG
jgi:hypothetical protein